MSIPSLKPATVGNNANRMTRDSDDRLQSLLDALNDPDCRAILRAVEERSMTANELSNTCELPLSTTYRKIDLLTSAALLEERTRIRSDGKHPHEYSCNFDEVLVNISDEGTFEVDVVRSNSSSSRSVVNS